MCFQIKTEIWENIQWFFLKHFPKKKYLADPIHLNRPQRRSRLVDKQIKQTFRDASALIYTGYYQKCKTINGEYWVKFLG